MRRFFWRADHRREELEAQAVELRRGLQQLAVGQIRRVAPVDDRVLRLERVARGDERRVGLDRREAELVRVARVRRADAVDPALGRARLRVVVVAADDERDGVAHEHDHADRRECGAQRRERRVRVLRAPELRAARVAVDPRERPVEAAVDVVEHAGRDAGDALELGLELDGEVRARFVEDADEPERRGFLQQRRVLRRRRREEVPGRRNARAEGDAPREGCHLIVGQRWQTSACPRRSL